MREVLFRGKRKDTGAWVFGDLVYSQYKIGDTCVGQYGNTVGIHQVNPETVGQFTGLTDKNGKKIFEGDILTISKKIDVEFNVRNVAYPVNAEVKWYDSGWVFETIRNCDKYLHFPVSLRCFDCEIIGSIHDNPELLEA